MRDLGGGVQEIANEAVASLYKRRKSSVISSLKQFRP